MGKLVFVKGVIFSLLLSILIHTGLFAQWKLSDFNLAHQYNMRSAVNVETIFVQTEENSIDLFLVLELSKGKLYNYTVNFYQLSTYDEALDTPYQMQDSLYLGNDGNKFNFQYRFPVSDLKKIVVVEVYDTQKDQRYYFDRRMDPNLITRVLPNNSNRPILNHYGPELRISTDTTLTISRYTYSFSVADPPMVTSRPLPSKGMQIDTVLVIDSVFATPAEGLYFIQHDPANNTGFPYKVTSRYFPKPATLPELVAPLIYITTEDEMRKLNSIDQKKQFDMFWLEMVGDIDRAKDLIKNYYSRVAVANLFFTGFKEGWKTDKGLIYIIFGPPDEVVKSDANETWRYTQNARLPAVEFDFIHAPGVYDTNYFVLIRNQRYESVWFRAVDLWRKGRF